MGRSIKDIVNRTINERKINIEHNDCGFLIVPTNFKTDNKIVMATTKKFTFDLSEGSNKIKEVCTETACYKRKPYVTASIDLFDIVRDLTKKGYLLFKYIIDNINYDSNRIDLDSDTIGRVINSNVKQVKSNALHELINKHLIEKVDTTINKHIYAINIQEVFKGNFTDFIYKYNNKYNNDKCSNREDADY